MVLKKVVFIQSVSGSIKYPSFDGQLEQYQPTLIIQNGNYGWVGEFDAQAAKQLIKIGLAIPYEDWQTHPQRPPFIRNE
ncbi:hypothetical protein COL82_19195 [Bacillus toyonensis]|uniref:hypothetical protein n=1 Tax=Bacillus toyonensis TaxID=155322 RepID=UPI000BF7D157|nr:hypothetical protein [Bacillus toyonensis]PFZ75900.1 hypothetical protein COL82_19195 [Bacillus toyonensis]